MGLLVWTLRLFGFIQLNPLIDLQHICAKCPTYVKQRNITYVGHTAHIYSSMTANLHIISTISSVVMKKSPNLHFFDLGLIDKEKGN